MTRNRLVPIQINRDLVEYESKEKRNTLDFFKLRVLSAEQHQSISKFHTFIRMSSSLSFFRKTKH